MGARTEREGGQENIEGWGGGRESRNLRSHSRGGPKGARGGVIPPAATTVARNNTPGRPSHHTEDQSPETGGEGQDRGGRRRGEYEQGTPEALYTRCEKREILKRKKKKRSQESIC